VLGEFLPIGIVSAALGAAATVAVQMIRGNNDLEKHWTKTTVELIDALRKELEQSRLELSKHVASTRELQTLLAHFDEALDHIHALISSDSDAEKAASQRRAQAFLKRMRTSDKHAGGK
jgi:uncharacterized membrane-anchored protein YhcB (DUF1043 family)